MTLLLARSHIARQRGYLLHYLLVCIAVENLLHVFELGAHGFERVPCYEEHAVNLLGRLQEGVVPVGNEGLGRVAGAFVGEGEGVGALAGGEEGVVEGVGGGGDDGELGGGIRRWKGHHEETLGGNVRSEGRMV